MDFDSCTSTSNNRLRFVYFDGQHSVIYVYVYVKSHVIKSRRCMSVAGYPRCKGVNPNRKSGVEPRRQLAGVFITFQQLLHPPWSPAVLTLSCHWIGPAGTRE